MNTLLNRITASLALALLAVSITACTTVAPATPVSVSARIQQISAQVPGDISLVLTPVLLKNPRYAPDVLLIGKTLPTLIQNGPITVGSISAALEQIPGLTAQEKQDLAYVSIGLPAALQLVNAITGKTIALYTDPNISTVVDAFCAGLVSAASAIPAVP